MPDPRFFNSSGKIALEELLKVTGAAPASGPRDIQIDSAAPLSAAGAGSVVYLADPSLAGQLQSCAATAVLLSAAHEALAPAGRLVLITRYPQASWAAASARLHSPIAPDGASGAIHPSADIGEGVTLAAGVVVSQGARIGAGSVVHAGASIGPGVCIGRNCEIGPNSTVRFALLGDGVVLAAGVRIGEAGFAVAGGPNGPVDVPQLGRAILQDGVSVGANSCVDRGGWDDTVVGENTKIDNLVHIGHNVRIGRNCRMAAFTGISGSVVVGDNVLFGGKAGVADWVTIGDGAAIGASASVFKNVPSREVWTGFPARPMRRWLREQATLARLSKARKGRADEHD